MCTGELSSKIFLLFHPVFRLNLKHPGLILGVPELLSDHSSTGMWPLWKILLLLLAPGAHAQGLPSHHLKCPWGNNNNYYHNKKITKEEQCQWNGPSLHTGPGQRAGLEIPKGRWCGCASPSMGWFVPGHNRREKASAWKSHFNTPTVWDFNPNPVPNMHLLFLLFFGYPFLLLLPLPPCEAFFR